MNSWKKNEGPLSEKHFEAFKEDWDKKFPESKGDYPYSGGLATLKVYEVPIGTLVRIAEYDGYETVELHPEDTEWL